MQQRQIKKKQDQTYKLPQNWAEQILNLESELSLNCSYSIIQDLMKIYSLVVEYFEFMGDPKYISYQERMHNMLTRPDVLKVITVYNEELSKKEKLKNQKQVQKTSEPPEDKQMESIQRAKSFANTNKTAIFTLDEKQQERQNQEVQTTNFVGKQMNQPLLDLKQNKMMKFKEKTEHNKKKRTAIVKLHLAKQEQEHDQPVQSQSVKELLTRHASSHELSYKALENDLKDQQQRFKDRLQKKKMEKSESQSCLHTRQRANTDFLNRSAVLDNDKLVLHEPVLTPKSNFIRKISDLIQEDKELDSSFQFETQNLKNTLQQVRKNRKHPKFMSMGSEAEMGGGPDIIFYEDELEQQIQQCLEQMIQQKCEELNKIKLQYDKQITEYEKQRNPNNPNDLLSKLIQHMKQSREAEIQKKSQELDESRKKAIRQLKMNYIKNFR